MSLRLLQKSVTNTGQPAAANGGKGRGKASGSQRSTRTMSLQQFQQQAAPAGPAAPQRRAWGATPQPERPAAAPTTASSAGKGTGRQSAWRQGPPSSMMDAVWAAPSAKAGDLGETAWDEPAALPEEEAYDGPSDWAAGPAEADAAAGAGAWETDGWEEPQQAEEGIDREGEAEEAEAAHLPDHSDTDIADEVTAWLQELNLLEHRTAVLQWCEDMGAASLEEVVDSADDLAEAITLKPLQVRRLKNKASEALQAVRSGGDAAAPSSDGKPAAASAEGDTGWKPNAGSFYAAASASAEPVQPAQSFYGSRSETLPEVDEDDDEPYLKQSPTERATWVPKAKVGQNSRKKQQRQAPSTDGSADPSENSKKRVEEAAQRLERQLQEEATQKTAEAQAALEAAIDSEDADKIRKAIQEAQQAGLDKVEVQRGEDALQRCLKKIQQQRQNAVCALQAILEAPRDKAFGANVRAAIEAAADTSSVKGSSEVLAAAEESLRQWELQEQRQGEAKMALQFAIRRGEAAALDKALVEAREAGLAESQLVAEAEKLLKEVRARERADAIALEALCRAVENEDLAALEEAVSTCTSRRLPLNGADSLLASLREKEKVRAQAAANLRSAMEGEDARLIKATLERGRKAGLAEEDLSAAESRISELEVALKRRENANVELYLARTTRDAKRLAAAIAEGRRAGLSEEVLQEAADELQEAQEAEERRTAARQAIKDAMRRRERGPLQSAIDAAAGILAPDGEEVRSATAELDRLEVEAKLAEEAAAREAAQVELRRAAAEGDWTALEAAKQAALDLGFSDDSELVQLATAKLEEMREAHEREEAHAAVRQVQDQIAELQQRETELAGPSHKKERSAIGKEIMALRSKPEYLSAARFLKNPEEERRRRVEKAHEIELAAAEERKRREKRQGEARAELSAAIEKRDEDAVRALVVEGLLPRSSADSAATFLAELDQRRQAADKDSVILEFSFAGLDRRDFFKASIAMNELLTDQYAMQEGADFKLKVVKASNSVLVAFRTRTFAAAVRQTATKLASGSVVADAEVRTAMEFGIEVQELLPAMRQDAQNLQQKPVRPESDAAVRTASQRAELPGTPGPAAVKKPAVSSGASLGTKAATVGPSHPQAAAVPRQATAGPPQNSPLGGVAAAGGSCSSSACPSSSKGAGRGAGGGRGPGAGAGAAGAGSGAEEVIPLPRQAAAMLQRDRATAATFHRDLKTFAGRFRVVAELQGLDAVVMRPVGMVHKEAMKQAHVELHGLLSYYFPERHDTQRWVELRVDPTHGAGIEITPCAKGYRIDHVEDFPGQDFAPGDVIVQINDRPLAGLADEDMEDTFGDCFADGAHLCLVKDWEQR